MSGIEILTLPMLSYNAITHGMCIGCIGCYGPACQEAS